MTQTGSKRQRTISDHTTISGARPKPKPGFDWRSLDAELRDSAPTGWRSRSDVPGGFTVCEFAERYKITQSAAYQRVNRLLRTGAIRKVARVMKTTVASDGSRKSTPGWIYDTVKKP